MFDTETEPECPGCHTEMVDGGLNGNYRVYNCSNGCAITIERPTVSDTGGITVESLSNLSSFDNTDK